MHRINQIAAVSAGPDGEIRTVDDDSSLSSGGDYSDVKIDIENERYFRGIRQIESTTNR